MPSVSHSLLNYLRVVVGGLRDDSRDDAVLLARFAEGGDEEAFKVLVCRHGPLVWQTCRGILGDTPDAEDAFQAVFLSLARKAGRFPVASLPGWLHQVARRAALNADASARRRRGLERRLRTETRPAAGQETNRAELYAAMDAELAGLPERLRVPLLLHYLEGKSQVEMARLLGCARSVVQYRLAKAEAALRKRLIRRGLEVSTIAILLTSSAAVSAVPARLISSTARAAVAFRSDALLGGAAEAARAMLGAFPASLETTVLRKGLLLWILLACCLGLGGTALVTCRLLGARPDERGEAGPVATQAAGAPEAGDRAAARVDCYGDPLPTGALARMGTVRLWHDGADNSMNPVTLAFSPNGKILASKSAGARDCRLWDVATGKEIRRLEKTGRYGLLAFSSDGRKLITGDYLWDVASGKLLRTYPRSKKEPGTLGSPHRCAMAFLPNGEILALEDFGLLPDLKIRMQRVWEVTTGKEISRVSGQCEESRPVFSPDGQLWATVDANKNMVRLWEVATGKEIRQLVATDPKSKAKEKPMHVVFSPDSKMLAVKYYAKGKVSLWEVATGKSVQRLEIGPIRYDVALVFSPDSKTLLVGGAGGEVKGQKGGLWDIATGKEIRSFDDMNVQVAVFSPNGKIVATADQIGAIRLWKVDTGKEIGPRQGNRGIIRALAYAPDGKTLASVSSGSGGDEVVPLWEVATGKEIAQLPKRRWGAKFVAYSPDRKLIALRGGYESLLNLWDTATGKKVLEFNGMWGAPNSENTVFSPDGKLLAAPKNMDGQALVCVFELPSGKKVYELKIEEVEPHLLSCWKTAFSPDGRVLAAAFNDDTIYVWDMVTGASIGQLGEHKQPAQEQNKKTQWRARALAFSPDGRILFEAKAGEDRIERASPGIIAAWEMATGQPIYQKPLLGSKAVPDSRWELVSFAFSPDSRILAMGSRNGKVYLWETATGRGLGQLTGHRATVFGLAFAPDGQTLASGSADITCLVWDIRPWTRRVKPLPAPPTEALSLQQLTAAWNDLASNNAAKAYRATNILIGVPKQSIPWLQTHIHPTATLSHLQQQQLRQWIKDLDSERFPVRAKAQQEIEKLGEPAIPVLRRALAGQLSLDVRRRLQQQLAKLVAQEVIDYPPQRLWELRAVQILKAIGTPEAQLVLQEWAQGMPEAGLTRHAQTALKSLAKCPLPTRP